MKLGFILPTVLLPVLVAGCNSFQPKTPGATFDRIGQEMEGALNAKPKGSEDALGQAMMPPLQLDLPTSSKSVEPRFDLAVSNAPAAQVFMALVSGTRYSMMVTPEVSGNVTVNLKNVTVREALETLRELYGYEYKVQGTRIYIQPNTLQTRVFKINYLDGKRQGQSELRVLSNTMTAQSAGAASTTSNAPVQPAGSVSGAPSSQITTNTSSDFWRDLGVAPRPLC